MSNTICIRLCTPYYYMILYCGSLYFCKHFKAISFNIILQMVFFTGETVVVGWQQKCEHKGKRSLQVN